MVEVPDELLTSPFTVRRAAELGVGRKVLRGPRFHLLFRGVYLAAHLEPTLQRRLAGALLVLPAGCVVSGVSAARLWGFDPRGHQVLEVARNGASRSVLPGVRVRRHLDPIPFVVHEGLPVTTPERTFVDAARSLGVLQLVMLADHLLHSGVVTFSDLVAFCRDHRLHGVRRARRVVWLADAAAESPMETLVRLMLVFARLPRPSVNVDVRTPDGAFVARVDLLYRAQKVVVEYDGWHHERDAAQRVRDLARRERLEALGYRVIVVTVGDLQEPRLVVDRVHRALLARGYAGPAPVTSLMWLRMFAAN